MWVLLGLILGGEQAAEHPVIGDAELRLFTCDPLSELASVLQVIMDMRRTDSADLAQNRSASEVFLDKMNQSPLPKAIHVITAWDNAISNNMLEFREQNVVAKRPGSRSCYPVAFAKIPSLKCKFSVRLDEVSRRHSMSIPI